MREGSDATREAERRGRAFRLARELSVAGMMGALGLALPMVVHAVGGGGAGRVLLPMHIPILMAGLLCSPGIAASVGLLVPLVSWALTQMPPMVPPIAPLMSIELAVLGLTASLIYRGGRVSVVLAVVGAMLAAGLVHGAGLWVTFPLFVPAGRAIPFWGYLAAGLARSIPGFAIQLVAVPMVIKGMQRIRRLG
ncbi:MAG: ECF transporter S component [Armatimonadota bacterium]